MNCPSPNCSICRRKRDKTSAAFTLSLALILVLQGVALWAGWIHE
jgi:hypothetical protein